MRQTYTEEQRERRRASDRLRYAKNRLKQLLRTRKYREEHKEKRMQTERNWRKNNKEYIKNYNKQYYASHIEEAKALHQAWYEKNGDHDKARHREYASKNKERRCLIEAKRRALKKNAPIADLTMPQWRAIKDHYGHKCVYCNRKSQRLTQDHITPLSKGGTHTFANIVPACRSCNSKKGNRAPLVPVQPLLLVG
jgi:5-methylcytosine-specific restriction endonuclease McrA